MANLNLIPANYTLSMFEASTEPQIILSIDCKITDVNQASLNLIGLSKEELIGNDFTQYFTDSESACQACLQAIEKNCIVDFPLALKHKNGYITEVLYNASRYNDINGNIVGSYVNLKVGKQQNYDDELRIVKQEKTHQTQEKEVRPAELVIANYARSLIEASRDPLFTITNNGKITDINEATLNATGVTRNDIIDTDFYLYFTNPEKAKEVCKEIFEKGYIANYPLTIKDNHLTEVLFNGSVYKNESGKILGAVLIARDITESKRIEIELTEAKIFAELAACIAEKAQSKAESATFIAENAVKAKQQFLSNMSHEIRTPMNAIIGFTKVILKTDLTAKQKEYLTAIKMSGDALIVLINDILDLAKVDAGKMTFEQSPFKMSLSISAMLHLFEPKIEEKNLRLIKVYDNKIPEVLLGDSVRLHQIILNLVSNAVKFTNKGEIIVSVKLINEDENSAYIEFSVKDTGIGISPEKIDEIFENFQQASSGTSRLYGGTGLGLAIAKQLVETQGGTMHVESELDKGTTFSFTLRFAKTSAQALPQITTIENNVPLNDIKILVVEDIALNQLLMKTLLDDFGFESDIAANGNIAIEKVKHKIYDIILMDLQMPELNGFEATEYIRNTLHSQVPIIALTADVTTVDLAKCKAVGMNDYIAKPVDEKLLFTKIVSFIQKKIDEKKENPLHLPETIEELDQCINLNYLRNRTKSNPDMMSEMIKAYLDQTPPLIAEMKSSFETKNWKQLHASVHKMIPSFSIMGMHENFENMAKKVQEYAHIQMENNNLHLLISQLERACLQACKELTLELNKYKSIQNE
ncbi:MAG TPA: ATP-binding protein [Chitinophagaceae bacterium]|nr:ATP-binding protein [Chitinophagaceae bacterium]